MTTKEFGRSIKNKYPQYRDIDDEELGKKMLQKYPQYQDMIDQQNVKPVASVVTQSRPSVANRLSNFVKGEITGSNPNSQSFLGSVAQSTVGSRGLLGAAQNVAKAFTSGQTLSQQGDLSDRITQLSMQTANLIKQRRTEQDPERKARLTRMIDSNWNVVKTLTDAREGLMPFTPTPKESLGTTVNALLTAYTGFGQSLAKQAGLKGLAKLGIRAAEESAIGAGFATGAALTENRIPTRGELATGAAIGAVIPVGGAGAKAIKTGAERFSGALSSKFIGSIIKPTLKMLSYGKDPAGQVAREGIVANSLEQLVPRIRNVRNKVGSIIGQTMEKAEQSGIRLNLEGVLQPIEDGIEAAKRNPRSNASVLQRLYDVRDDLLRVTNDATGNTQVGRILTQMSPLEAFNLKEDIAQITKWTGNDSDDRLVNKALQRVYTNVRKTIDQAVPEVRKLNERWGNLLTAEKAAERQANIKLRQNIISLGLRVSGVGAGIGGIVTSILTGNPAPAILGLGVTGMEYIFSTPAAKTRLAKWLATASREERTRLFENVPVMKNVIERIFGSDATENIPQSINRNLGNSAYAAAAGFETDDQGNANFNTGKAALAVGASLVGARLLSKGMAAGTERGIARKAAKTRSRVSRQLRSQM